MSDRRRPEPPRGLSAWARATWRQLTSIHVVEEHEAIALRRALRWWDLSDAWLRESEAVAGREQARLVKQSMDAANTALRHWRLLKFEAPAAVPARPGRPSGFNWSAARKVKTTDLRGRTVNA
jgi:hypothetical protein